MCDCKQAVIDFEFTKESGIEKGYQVRSNVIPMIGSKYTNGDYRKETDRPDPAHMGDVREVLTGIVEDVQYFYEETGDCSQRYDAQLYVTVILRPLS